MIEITGVCFLEHCKFLHLDLLNIFSPQIHSIIHLSMRTHIFNLHTFVTGLRSVPFLFISLPREFVGGSNHKKIHS